LKVLLVVDVVGWAWYLKAKELQKHLPYDVEIKCLKDFSNKDFANFDSIHSFGWYCGGRHNRMTSAISSHNYKLLHAGTSRKALPGFAGLSCVSSELYELAKKEKLNKNLYLCCNGVDEEKFYPDYNKNDKFVVGWVGQKTSGTLSRKPYDIKGYEHILLPVMERLKLQKNIEFLVHPNNHKNAIPHSKMPKVYHKMDALISTSFLEGTPGSVFEAAASGLPVISTSVGCVPELITTGENGIIVPRYKNKNDAKRVVNIFAKKILFLSKYRDIARAMGEKNREEIEKNWTWKDRSKQWIPLLENHTVK
jgi:glycosyltransferase involved in cell wall biosynthesis